MPTDVSVNRRKGMQFERDLLDSLRENGYEAERLKQTGMRDEGDLVVRPGVLHVVIEAKAPGPGGRVELGPWLAEAEVEAGNYARSRSLEAGDVRPLLVVKARGKSPQEAFAITRLGEYLGQYAEVASPHGGGVATLRDLLQREFTNFLDKVSGSR